MTCKLCEGTKVVYSEIMQGVMVAGPCPNCTNYVHEHYENELSKLWEQHKVEPERMGA